MYPSPEGWGIIEGVVMGYGGAMFVMFVVAAVIWVNER